MTRPGDSWGHTSAMNNSGMRTAVEADRPHGLVAGTMTGAWTVNRELAALIRVMKHLPPVDYGAAPDAGPAIEDMAVYVLEQHKIALRAISELTNILRA